MHWMIYANDRENSLALRMATRPSHIEYLKSQDFVILISGGPLLDDAGENMCGSIILVEAETLDDVEKFCANDPYKTADLFAKTTIKPFKWVLPFI